MAKYIAGLNVGNHDSSAALVKDGVLLSFIEQERISRNKMAFGEPPILALQSCLKQEGISFNDVEAVAVGMDWKYRNRFYRMDENEIKKYKMFENEKWFLPNNCLEKKQIYVIQHHLAHASSAFRLSGFDSAAVLVVDNRGEDASTSLGIAKNGNINFFKKINIHNSLGIFYNRACQYTGLYGKFREVGKFMGLASYGIPKVKMPLKYSKDSLLFKDLPDLEQESVFDAIQHRSMQLLNYFEKNCYPYILGNRDDIMSYANFAASAQNALEDVLVNLVRELKDVTGLDNLVIAGGIAQNCSANGKIEESNIFKNIFIPPFASDAGTAVGAALECDFILRGFQQKNCRLYSADLGLSYSITDVLKILNSYQNICEWNVFEEHLYDVVSDYLSEGCVIGFVQGRFEAGPRALGYRSILADPRDRKSLVKLNKIKKREMWRPIAPSILKERYSDYFEGSPENKYFMNIAVKVKRSMRHKIPAVVHVDESARPQVVDSNNENFYSLLKAFEKKTGIPVLCNTSFNLQGMPLVNTPENAISAFLNSNIDVLVLDNIIVKRKS